MLSKLKALSSLTASVAARNARARRIAILSGKAEQRGKI
jgi:hypothetical protein